MDKLHSLARKARRSMGTISMSAVNFFAPSEWILVRATGGEETHLTARTFFPVCAHPSALFIDLVLLGSRALAAQDEQTLMMSRRCFFCAFPIIISICMPFRSSVTSTSQLSAPHFLHRFHPRPHRIRLRRCWREPDTQYARLRS